MLFLFFVALKSCEKGKDLGDEVGQLEMLPECAAVISCRQNPLPLTIYQLTL